MSALHGLISTGDKGQSGAVLTGIVDSWRWFHVMTCGCSLTAVYLAVVACLHASEHFRQGRVADEILSLSLVQMGS